MRISNGHWYCDLCGARIDGVSLRNVPAEDRMMVPGRVTRRVLRVDGREVHRCEIAASSDRGRAASLSMAM